MLIIVTLSLAVFLTLSLIACLYFYKANRERIEYNQEQASRNEQLQQEAQNYIQKIDFLTQEITIKQQAFQTLNDSLNAALSNQDEIVKKEISDKYKEYTKNAEKEFNGMFNDLLEHSRDLRLQIASERQQLKNLEDKQQAYIEELSRREEMKAKQDYYRLNLSPAAEADVTLLRELQIQFSHKEAIDKVIWDVYYKPAYDILMSHLFQNKTGDICGIYKITCLTNEKAYIGQSVNIKERFRSHIKAALDCGVSTNKLYQEMKKEKPSNFTFEILEIVPRNSLNEREIYWINFYKTKEFGLNKTAGGS